MSGTAMKMAGVLNVSASPSKAAAQVYAAARRWVKPTAISTEIAAQRALSGESGRKPKAWSTRAGAHK